MATRINWKQSLGMMAFGMLFFAAGVFLVLAGTGILPIDKSRLGGPQWLLAFVGLVFGLPGWFYVSAGAKSLLRGGQLDRACPKSI